MNKVEAIIRPEKLTSVKDALAEAGLVGLNVVRVTGRGRQKGVVVGSPRGVGSHVVDMLPKVKLELVVSDGDTRRAIDIIIAQARTPMRHRGDGKIFITPNINADFVKLNP